VEAVNRFLRSDENKFTYHAKKYLLISAWQHLLGRFKVRLNFDCPKAFVLKLS